VNGSASVLAEALKEEDWLAERIHGHIGRDVLQGAQTAEQRREMVRAAIVESGLDQVICGSGADRKPRTYAQVFKQIYGLALAVNREAACGHCHE
jgi:hypothetical protein